MTDADRACSDCDTAMTHDGTIATDTHRTDYWYCTRCNRYHRVNTETRDHRQGDLFA